MDRLCGRCGQGVSREHWDDHQRLHLDEFPHRLGAWVVPGEGEYTLGVNVGFDFSDDPALLSTDDVDRESRDHLVSELAAIVRTHKGDAVEGYYVVPDDISEFPATATAISDLAFRNFPEYFPYYTDQDDEEDDDQETDAS